ncbi:MAG: hypothetical protein ACTHKS_14035 [Gaiellaceae bacterium]
MFACLRGTLVTLLFAAALLLAALISVLTALLLAALIALAAAPFGFLIRHKTLLVVGRTSLSGRLEPQTIAYAHYWRRANARDDSKTLESVILNERPDTEGV